jgi:hypothetical protein
MRTPCHRIQPFLRESYHARELDLMADRLQPALEIHLTPDGFLPAATRGASGEPDPTHYNAVWVRDSMWGYLAFADEKPSEAKKILRGLLRYFGTPGQLNRLRAVIAEPERASDCMQVLHIRFEASTLDDVVIDGKPQYWNHKQNDALGLFYAFALCALKSGMLDADALSAGEWECLLRLPTYWDRIGFDSMEDSGSWEEIERVSTSSVGLVTNALECAKRLLGDTPFRARLEKVAREMGLDLERESLFNGRLAALIDAGYARIFRQLPFESPDYPPESARYREADAALLNLIYPCRLDRLRAKDRLAIVKALSPLIGEVGIKRYEGDAYQSGNYWRGGSPEALTDDCSAEASFAARRERMIRGTEAQWFFDSWLSTAYGVLFEETRDESFRVAQSRFFNRAVAQLTDDSVSGADGQPVPPFALPESYNTLVNGSTREFVPSPITPLNWAKCSLRVAMAALAKTL